MGSPSGYHARLRGGQARHGLGSPALTGSSTLGYLSGGVRKGREHVALRAYSESELREMVASLHAPDYEWEIGAVPSRWAPMRITYVLGVPLRRRR